MSFTPITAFYRLWCAVILQALEDIEVDDKIRRAQHKARKMKRNNYKIQEWMEIKHGASLWMRNKSLEAGSFLWICEHCDLDPKKLLSISATHEGRVRLLQGNIRISSGEEEDSEQEAA